MKHPSQTAAIRLILITAMTLLPAGMTVAAADSLEVLEQKAFQNAARQVAPSVVRIETLTRAGDDAATRMIGGPTSGLVVDSRGLIITSAAPFVSKPSTILVQTPEGQRYAGKLSGIDFLRMLALLEVDAKQPLTMPQIDPNKKPRVGAWAIAVGRAFDPRKTNMTVGIISGLDRIGGKAIQTDAATSPNNYGGPLIDIHGHVLGVIVPLSEKKALKPDVSRYDSGIGFAIPIGDILNEVLPRLKKQSVLKPGTIGVGFGKVDPNTAELVVKAVAPDSPADKAKIRVGDRLVAINTQEIHRVVELHDILGRHYAGDVVTVTFDRNGVRQKAKLTLGEYTPPKRKKQSVSGERKKTAKPHEK